MHKNIREQPPPLAGERQRAKIVAPQTNLCAEIHDARAFRRFAQRYLHRHRHKYRDVDAQDNLRNPNRGRGVPGPRRAHHRLRRVIDNLAALLSLMLHAPLADLLAETKASKLASTSNAIGHGLLKEYQQSGSQGEGTQRLLKNLGSNKGEGHEFIRAVQASEMVQAPAAAVRSEMPHSSKELRLVVTAQ
jgi:hypothetical protein